MEFINEYIKSLETHIKTVFNEDYEIIKGLRYAHTLADYFDYEEEKNEFRKNLSGYKYIKNSSRGDKDVPDYRIIDAYKKTPIGDNFIKFPRKIIIWDSIENIINKERKLLSEKDKLVPHSFNNRTYYIDLKTLKDIKNSIKAELHSFFIKVLKEQKIDVEENIEYDKNLLELIQNKSITRRLEESWKCYQFSCYEAGAILLRKVLEISLHIALKIKYQKNDGDNILYDTSSSNRIPHQLPKKLNVVQNEGLLSKSLLDNLLSQTKFFGDLGAHDFNITIKKNDYKNANSVLRKALEHMFNAAKNP